MMQQSRSAVMAGLGIGAGLMFFLDPERGRRRRALIQNKLTRSSNISLDGLGATGRDLRHRAEGAAARVRGIWSRRPVHDTVLVERVRARLGRLVSHPHAIDVEARDGQVILRGPILQSEVKRLIRDIERVHGVRGVVNALEEHKQAGNTPALQGGGAPAIPQFDIWQREWSPTTRLLAGTTGAALAGYGASRRDVPGSCTRRGARPPVAAPACDRCVAGA
jgi:uncharacterized protein YwbE